MRKAIIVFASLLCTIVLQAQSFKETFDGNSLDWSEQVFDNDENVKYLIKDGCLILHSEVNSGIDAEAISTCYAPINMEKPFKIITHLTYEDDDNPFMILFNLKDDGTYYCFWFREAAKKVWFIRKENNEEVGGWTQGFPYPKLKKGEQLEVVISSDCQTLYCEVQGIPLFNLRYIQLQYQGFGFMTLSDQEIKVDDVEFIQM